MENQKITGNEPYFPTPIANYDGGNSVIVPKDPGMGITIRQKFIMDYACSIARRDPTITQRNEIIREAHLAFRAYLRIINEPQP